jgi:polysulfide reductase chain C
MTWGVWVLTPFIPLALVLGWLEVDFLSPPWRIVTWARGLALRWRTRLLQVGALLAIAIAIYTGVLLGVLQAVPLWNSFILPMIFFVSAMSTGLAASVLLSQVLAAPGKNTAAHASKNHFYLNRIHLALIITELVFILSWLFVVASGSMTAAQSVGMLLSGRYSVFFWVGIVLIGIFGPMLVYMYEVVLHRSLKLSWVLIGDGSVLLGGLVLRYLVIAAGLPVILT